MDSRRAAVQILLQLPQNLATTLLRVTIAPQQHAPLAADPTALAIPGQLSTLPAALFPLVMHACAPCIDTHRALAVRAAPDSHAILVGTLPQLTTLTALTVVIPRFDATDVDVSLLMHAIRRLPHLSRISITDEESNSQRMVSLALSLAAAPSLRSLSLTIPGEPYGMGLLLDALQQRQPQTLRALELCCTMTDVHAPQLTAMLPGLTSLRELTLRQAQLSHELAAELVAVAVALPGFTRLALDHVLRFRGDADNLCAAIGRVNTLRALQIREAPGGIPLLTGLGDALARHISSCSTLTALDLGTSLPPASLQPLGELLWKLPGLRWLSVRGARRLYNDIGGLRTFMNALQQLQGLTELDLGGCAITVPVAVEIAAALPALRALCVLWMDNACMQSMYDSWAEPAAQIAPALALMPALHDLSLDSCSLGFEGVSAVVPALGSMAWLRRLRLRQNGLGAAAARRFLPALLNLTRLQVLDLAGNEITGEAMAVLACAFEGLRDLRNLDLSDNPLMLDGAVAFAEGVSVTSSSPTASDPARASAVSSGGGQPCDVVACMGHVSLSDSEAATEDEGPQHPARGHGAAAGGAAAVQTALMRLEQLHLQRCSLGAVGLAALLPAVGAMVSLREVWLGVDGIRSVNVEGTIAQLLAANPSLFVA